MDFLSPALQTLPSQNVTESTDANFYLCMCFDSCFVSLFLSAPSEDEDPRPEATVGSLAGHQQSAYEIEKRFQVSAIHTCLCSHQKGSESGTVKTGDVPIASQSTPLRKLCSRYPFLSCFRDMFLKDGGVFLCGRLAKLDCRLCVLFS